MRKHPNDIDKELSLIKERVEAMFQSGDREMIKLGQRLCHQHRINYYILAEYSRISNTSYVNIRGNLYRMQVTRYSLNRISDNGRYYQRTYLIRLSRDYKPIRVYTPTNLIYRSDLKYRARHRSLTKLK